MALLGDRLRDMRRHFFVGRTEEIDLFRAALLALDGPASVLFLHGPGGVGKSALLDALAEVATAEGTSVHRVDGRYLPPVPGALTPPIGTARPVLLLDSYELLAEIDPWVREEFLPAMPGDAVVVLAGRQPPASPWLSDPAWRELLRVVALRNLPPQDSRAYLTARGVPETMHDQLLSISHGHPLTLSLLVGTVQQGTTPRRLSDLPNLVGTLLTHIVEEAPGPRHRMALEVCAHAHVTTEDLLRGLLGDTGELFAWLRTLPFVDEGPYGLFPHDVARDALDADLRWRAPDRYTDLHQRVRAHLLARVRSAQSEREQLQLLADAIAVTCPRAGLAAYVTPPRPVQEYIDELRDSDRAEIAEMTDALQGHDQAELVTHWMRRQPHAFRVFRGPDDEPRGYGACLELTADDLDRDPGVDAMWAYAQRHDAPRPGERVRAWRFFLDRDAHHGSSPLLTLFAAWQMLDFLTQKQVAWSLMGTYSDAELWGPTLNLLDFWEAHGATYTVGGIHYAVFAHDWRRTPLEQWLELILARELGAAARPSGQHSPELLLSQPEFADAVRAALRNLHEPELLNANPLLRSPAVLRHRRPEQTPAESLRTLLGMAVEALGRNRRDSGLHEIADRTFLQGAAPQERIAETLHLSFSTYRRHRDRAVAKIVAWMWQREIYGPGHESGDQNTAAASRT